MSKNKTADDAIIEVLSDEVRSFRSLVESLKQHGVFNNKDTKTARDTTESVIKKSKSKAFDEIVRARLDEING